MAQRNLKKIPPLNIYEFRKVDESAAIEVPEIASNRKHTDVAFLFLFTEAFFLTIVIVTCTAVINTDYYRFLNGYDKCGDTCGRNNKPIAGITCSGKDLTNKPYMKYQFTGIKNKTQIVFENVALPNECVAGCEPPNRLMFQRCVPPTDMPIKNNILNFMEFLDDLHRSALIILLPMIATILSIAYLYSFCLSAKFTIFFTLVMVIVSLMAFSSVLWFCYVKESQSLTVLVLCVLSAVAVFFVGIFVCYFHDYYTLLIELFAEASEAMLEMPCIKFLPIPFLIYLAVTVSVTCFLICYIDTFGNLKKHPNFEIFDYQQTKVSEVSITYLILLLIWNLSFIDGWQCLIVSGAISTFYFQKGNLYDLKPIRKSFRISIRFHLGTVAFGSLCTSVLTLVRIVTKVFEKYVKCKVFWKSMEVCLLFFEQVIKYLTKRAYIQTAMHGTALYISGMRAARLIWANLLNTISLDAVSDLIIYSIIIIVILSSVGVGAIIYYAIDTYLRYFWAVLLIGSVASALIVYFFMQIINVSIETIFICYCEDKLLNDGKNRPHLMSERLKTLIDRAKQVANKREEE